MPDSTTAVRTRARAMLALVVAGEMIFSLPFHLPRYFRPSVLATFGLSNAQLGDVFALYGVTAMLAYFPGGALADRFPARGLMCASLLATAAGGLYLLTLPGTLGLTLLYGYWGVTTILLFWAALIRATRNWGGQLAQGRAFGILDGGRGLVAATVATVAVACFSLLAGHDVQVLGATERRAALRAVILLYTGATVIAAALVWRWVPADMDRESTRRRFDVGELVAVLRLRVVWLQAVIVVCAYCGYKGLDNYGLYAHQVLGFSEISAAGISASGAYIRPLAAVLAGLSADRLGVARSIVGLFGLLILVYSALGLLAATAATQIIIYGNLALSFAAVFALRGVYFALLEATAVPARLTGAAVGLVSLVGYTPDIFFAAVAGRLLDAAPGAAGHQHYFILLAVLAIIGLAAAALLVPARATAASQSRPYPMSIKERP